jgi:shikimate kinase
MNNIILTGYMGSGKTSVALALIKLSSFTYLDTDEIIEEKAGKSIAWIFKNKGEAYFRKLESEICLSLINYNNTIISTGGGIVLKPKNRASLKKAGLVFLLEASVEETLNRIAKCEQRPLLQVKDKEDKIRKMLEERKEAYIAAADYKINTNDSSIEEVAYKIWQIYRGKYE